MEIKQFYKLTNKKLENIKYAGLKENRVNRSLGAKIWLKKMQEKGMKNEEYRDEVSFWLRGKTKTIGLRNILKQVGLDYWGDLHHGNDCDFIDSYHNYK